MNNELIQTLRSIRNTFLLGVLFLGVTAASNVYFAWDTANDNRLQQAARGFRMQADALRYNLQYDELLTQAKARQKSHPQDADGFFYEGLALFYKRDYAASISLFQKAAQVANTQEAREMADKWIVSARKEMKVSIN